MDISEILNNYGEEREMYFNAAAPPIVQASNYIFKTVDEMRESLAHEDETFFYTRGNNPTTLILQKKMAALEHTEDALIFASGSAAIGAAVMANLQAGDHVVCVRKPYSWTTKLLQNILSRYGVTHTFVEGDEVANFEKAIQANTKIIYLESPNSWTFEMQDLEAVLKIAKSIGILSIVDNSYASPLNMTPADWGADIIVHSGTKYLSGHSDTVAGVLCASAAMCKKIFKSEFMTLGGIISPFNAWLLIRGLRTLSIRMEKVAQTTPQVVDFLSKHPKVAKVYYPFSPSHPQYELAKKQMKRPAGQFTIVLATEKPEEVERFCNSLTRFLMGCSWGGYESLIFPAATLYSSQNYQTKDLPYNMIRFYCGLEEPQELIADLQQAFDKI
ncbi:aminotransferase class I/II-fold pyridoxal phosphate-dependent enzyme [Cytophagales bacterium LB-30]|uniref:Aminotransferase class I/II-fold pyridoxal phosphate-dependent enzyme n=1 Tax=Shiella aurantiaca TaxID=3058365 RepID=A0ABT8F9G4_9BACT|nr:aminotransferase class I/II-fold pyridoxal phosphate-dependent enzyme [Shiella aurantiaca]MDN4167018.1 aminotransferase class I/II-fold pyridoxal phosphate-dependent enzyme [Shiella aurantiaca]